MARDTARSAALDADGDAGRTVGWRPGGAGSRARFAVAWAALLGVVLAQPSRAEDPVVAEAQLRAFLGRVSVPAATHYLVWGAEGHLDREGGEKRDAVLVLGASTMPYDLSDQKVTFQEIPGVRYDPSGDAALLTIDNPAGADVTFDSASGEPVHFAVDPDDFHTELRDFLLPRMEDEDALLDARLLGWELGVRRGGVASEATLVDRGVESDGKDLYRLTVAFADGSGVTVDVGLDAARRMASLAVVSASATAPWKVGFRSPSALDSVLDAYSIGHTGAGYVGARASLDLALRDATCTPGETVKCLQHGRFRVSERFFDHGTPRSELAGRFAPDLGEESFVASAFSASNKEQLGKVLDGCALNGRFWVFYGTASDTEHFLKVEDLVTGRTRVYHNPDGRSAPTVTDTEAFPCEATLAPGTVQVETTSFPNPGTLAVAVTQGAVGPCVPTATTACLRDGLFEVSTTAWDHASPRQQYAATFGPEIGSESFLSAFFSPTNKEQLGKVLDGCGLNGKYWVFGTNVTDTELYLKVRKTDTGEVRTYHQQDGLVSPALTDTGAFDCGQARAAQTAPTAHEALRADLAAIFAAMSVTANGRAPAGVVLPHHDLSLRADGANLVAIGKEYLDNSNTHIFAHDARMVASLVCLPSTSSDAAFGLVVDPYASLVQPATLAETIAVTLGGVTVRNSSPQYATGVATGTLGQAIKDVCNSGVVLSKSQALKNGLYVHMVNMGACNDQFFSTGCNQPSGVVVSPQNDNTKYSLDGKFGNSFLNLDQWDTLWPSGRLNNAYMQETSHSALQGKYVALGMRSVSTGAVNGPLIVVDGSASGGSLSPASGYTLDAYCNSESTCGQGMLTSVPDWSLPKLPPQ